VPEQPNGGPIFNPMRRALGEERMDRFVQGHAAVQAMALFLVSSTMIVPHAGYSDDALDAMKQDAIDVRNAADNWARQCEELAEAWRAQRGPMS
jgi:hypothetical protein